MASDYEDYQNKTLKEDCFTEAACSGVGAWGLVRMHVTPFSKTAPFDLQQTFSIINVSILSKNVVVAIPERSFASGCINRY